MESVEIDSRFWKIIGNPDADVSEEDFPSYLAEITRFGLNTTIVPKFELDKYLKKLAKKRAEPEPEEVEEDAAD